MPLSLFCNIYCAIKKLTEQKYFPINRFARPNTTRAINQNVHHEKKEKLAFCNVSFRFSLTLLRGKLFKLEHE